MFNSAAVEVTLVPPISNVVMDTSPATVNIPLATVIKSVSPVCPIVDPFTMTLSTVNVVNVPKDVTFAWAAVCNVPASCVAVSLPVLGLYVKSPSDSKPTLPVADVSSIKGIKLFSFVLSLSATDTWAAFVAFVAFVTVTPAITVLIAVPSIVIASASSVPSISASPDISKVAPSSSPVIVKFLIPV